MNSVLSDSCESWIPLLSRAADSLGVSLDSKQTSMLARYGSLIQRANERINLTGLRSSRQIMLDLILDSIAVASVLPAEYVDAAKSTAVVDVGAGAGIPGIPLAIVAGSWSLALIESMQKKAAFLREAIAELGLSGITVVTIRAEDAAAGPPFRDAAELCLARAVAPLPTLLELCAPFVAVGGYLALPKGSGAADEVEAARPAQIALRLSLTRVAIIPTADVLPPNRHVVLYQKRAPTPPEYPRRVGLARSRPIGTR